MRKMLLCMGVALATTISIGHAQTLQSLKDSCYHYLAIQDIASFNAYLYSIARCVGKGDES